MESIRYGYVILTVLLIVSITIFSCMTNVALSLSSGSPLAGTARSRVCLDHVMMEI